MQIMKDIDIRGPLIKRLTEQNEKHSHCQGEENGYRIIPELAVCDGMSRVDVAVANGNLCGYEIKSDADTLDRLKSQVMYYNKTFDKVFIVVGSKFEKVIAEHVPDWWGIYVASYNKNDEIILKERRRGRKNQGICAASLLELLWREEVERLLKECGFQKLSGKNRWMLREIAETNIPLSIIRDYTRETLKNRKEWRE